MVPLIADNFVGLRHGTPDEPEPLSSKRPINLKLSDDGHYQQITDDSGLSAKLGDLGGAQLASTPKIGFIIPLSEGYQGYLNLKVLKDISRSKTEPTHQSM